MNNKKEMLMQCPSFQMHEMVQVIHSIVGVLLRCRVANTLPCCALVQCWRIVLT